MKFLFKQWGSIASSFAHWGPVVLHKPRYLMRWWLGYWYRWSFFKPYRISSTTLDDSFLDQSLCTKRKWSWREDVLAICRSNPKSFIHNWSEEFLEPLILILWQIMHNSILSLNSPILWNFSWCFSLSTFF